MNTIDNFIEMLENFQKEISDNVRKFRELDDSLKTIEATIKRRQIELLKKWSQCRDSRAHFSLEFEMILALYRQVRSIALKKSQLSNATHALMSGYVETFKNLAQNYEISQWENMAVDKVVPEKLRSFLTANRLIQFQHYVQIKEPDTSAKHDDVFIKTGSDDKEVRLPKLKKVVWPSNLPHLHLCGSCKMNKVVVLKNELDSTLKLISSKIRNEIPIPKCCPVLVGRGKSTYAPLPTPILLPTTSGQCVQVRTTKAKQPAKTSLATEQSIPELEAGSSSASPIARALVPLTLPPPIVTESSIGPSSVPPIVQLEAVSPTKLPTRPSTVPPIMPPATVLSIVPPIATVSPTKLPTRLSTVPPTAPSTVLSIVPPIVTVSPTKLPTRLSTVPPTAPSTVLSSIGPLPVPPTVQLEEALTSEPPTRPSTVPPISPVLVPPIILPVTAPSTGLSIVPPIVTVSSIGPLPVPPTVQLEEASTSEPPTRPSTVPPIAPVLVPPIILPVTAPSTGLSIVPPIVTVSSIGPLPVPPTVQLEEASTSEPPTRPSTVPPIAPVLVPPIILPVTAPPTGLSIVPPIVTVSSIGPLPVPPTVQLEEASTSEPPTRPSTVPPIAPVLVPPIILPVTAPSTGLSIVPPIVTVLPSGPLSVPPAVELETVSTSAPPTKFTTRSSTVPPETSLSILPPIATVPPIGPLSMPSIVPPKSKPLTDWPEKSAADTCQAPFTLTFKKVGIGWSLIKQEVKKEEDEQTSPIELSCRLSVKYEPISSTPERDSPRDVFDNKVKTTVRKTSRELEYNAVRPLEKKATSAASTSVLRKKLECEHSEQLQQENPMNESAKRKKKRQRKIKSASSKSEEAVAESSRNSQNYKKDTRTYCICNQEAYGNMIACDNESCPREWFHYLCVGIAAVPKKRWYCPGCVKRRIKDNKEARKR